MQKQPLKSRDVAHILDMSPDDCVVLAQRGTLRAEKVGRRWRYDRRSVMAYKRRIERGLRDA